MKKSEQLHEFRKAKQLAFNLPRNHYQRIGGNDEKPGNYCGYKTCDGRTFVIADSSDYMQNPDCWIDGKPARRVYDGFTVMKK